MSHTAYVEFETGEYKGHHIKRVGCMKCNDTIGSKNPDGTLYYWDHKRDVKLVLSNATVAYAPVCRDCFVTITDVDLNHLENTIKHGWLLEQTWMLKRQPARGTKHLMGAAEFARNIFVVKRGD